ncbi:MAG: TetR/AcrR family transcriptional regulator [Chloroflexi bacterium]|nr:TetR/AcrR family transcriptional regulator [Chloroflexota bacterium]
MTLAASKNIKAEHERERIQQAAATVFQERGYVGTTMEHIARQMGVTKGFIYYYYKSKDDVFYDLHSQAMKSVHAYVQSRVPKEGSPLVKLEAAFTAHVEHVVQRAAMGFVAARTASNILMPTFPAKYRRILTQERDRFHSIYDAIIDEGVREGLFGEAESKAAIRLVMGAITWMPNWYRTGGAFDTNAIAALLVRMFLSKDSGAVASKLGLRLMEAQR